MSRHVFDSGRLWLAPVGTSDALTMASQYEIGEVQKVGFNGTYEKTEMSAPAVVSMFKVDVAFYGGNSTLSCEVGDYNGKLLERLMGATPDTATTPGWTRYPVGVATKPSKFKLIFEGVDTDGKKFRIIMPNAAAPGFSADHSIGSFAMPSFEATGYQVGSDPAYTIMTEN
jgi:hypothetical protein